MGPIALSSNKIPCNKLTDQSTRLILVRLSNDSHDDIYSPLRSEILNALGIISRWTIQQLDYVSRASSATMLKMHWGLWGDLWTITTCKSLSPLFYDNNETDAIAFEQVVLNTGTISDPFTPQDLLFRQHVGPFGSIDMYWIMYPPELNALWQVVTETTTQVAVESEKAMAASLEIPAYSMPSINPLGWYKTPEGTETNWSFLGSSPLCKQAFNQRDILLQCSFDDSCTTSYIEATAIDQYSAVFAYVASIAATGEPVVFTGLSRGGL